MKQRIALIGPGRLGQAVGALLQQAGYPITAIVGRDQQRTHEAAEFIGASLMAGTDLKRCSRAELVLCCVGDDQLAPLGEALLDVLADTPSPTVIHFSGRHRAAILRPDDPRAAHWQVMSLHPLQTFASGEQGLNSLPGSYCAVEGNDELFPLGAKLSLELGCQPFRLRSEDKERYHAAACMASNFVTTLFHQASTLMAETLEDPAMAKTVLAPIFQTAVTNTLNLGPHQALTGPIVRGDIDTIRGHLDQLAEHNPQRLSFYLELAEQTRQLALESERLAPERATQLKELLDSFTSLS